MDDDKVEGGTFAVMVLGLYRSRSTLDRGGNKGACESVPALALAPVLALAFAPSVS